MVVVIVEGEGAVLNVGRPIVATGYNGTPVHLMNAE